MHIRTIITTTKKTFNLPLMYSKMSLNYLIKFFEIYIMKIRKYCKDQLFMKTILQIYIIYSGLLKYYF